MKTRWLVLVVSMALLGLLLSPIASTHAQDVPSRLAFVNTSGQLVVTDADGQTRWIVTQPNEMLHPTVGYTWSPDGTQLFFALADDTLGAGDPVRLQLGDVAAQQRSDLATVNEPVSGGGWHAGAVYIGTQRGIVAYTTQGERRISDGDIRLISPYDRTTPHLPTAQSLAPDGGYILGAGSSTYTITANNTVATGDSFNTPIVNTIDARKSGLWAVTDAAQMVAIWGSDTDAPGRTALYVVNMSDSSQPRLSIASDGQTPLLPLLWLPDSTQLVYRDPTGQIRLADVGCLVGATCGADNPLETGTLYLPASAAEVQVMGDWVYFRNGDAVQAQPVTCAAADNCESVRLTLGTQAAPRTILHTRNGIIMYTAFVNNPADPADREIRILDSACLPDNCTPRPFLSGAVGGTLSPDATYLLTNVLDDGLYIIRLSDGSRVYLTGSDDATTTRLITARWNQTAD